MLTDMDAGVINEHLGNRWVLQTFELATTPHIVRGEDNKQLLFANDHFYVRGHFDIALSDYSIVQRHSTYLDPVTNELLGLEVLAIGQAKLVAIENTFGIFKLISAQEQVLVGHQIIPSARNISVPADLENQVQVAVSEEIEGQIIDILTATNNDKTYDVLAINQGIREGLQRGNILNIYDQTKALQKDDVGLVVIMHVFEKMSFGIVVEKGAPLAVGDLLHVLSDASPFSAH